MLSPILSKASCASCKFCCSFRRQSLWETPLFDKVSVERLKKLFPGTKFRPVQRESFTIDLYNEYKTQNPDEEAACPFLDAKRGCVLPPELKPFDCSIWPLRAMRLPKSEEVVVALTPTCQAINRQPLEAVKSFIQSGIGKKILDYAKSHPDMVKEFHSDFIIFVV